MFTGIIEEIGIVNQVKSIGNGRRLLINAERIMDDLKVEDSVSINGACQTVVEKETNSFVVEAVGDTLSKTTLGELKMNSPVNLERALTFQTRLGGHLVAGHINGTAQITRILPMDNNWFLHLKLPKELLKYCMDEGSIAIDGVSLTIAEVMGDEIRISVINHTFRNTIINTYRVGTRVNIETDMIARYVENLLTKKQNTTGLNLDDLKSWGY